MRSFCKHASLISCCLIGLSLAAPVYAADADGKPAASSAKKKPRLDHSAKPRKGKASYYGREFYGKKMANGKKMNPNSNVAASKTLPLGTTAKVTNLENGKSEVVKITDRGPYKDGRIVDVSPKTAEKLDMKKDGVATVEVKPLQVPAPGSSATGSSSSTGSSATGGK